MNTKKFLVGALLGGIVAFMAGGMLYAVVFKDMLAEACPGLNAVSKDPPDMMAMIVGNLAMGTLLSYIFEKWAGIRTPLTGLTSGALIGALIAFSYDSMFHGTTTLMSWGGVILDTAIFAIVLGLTGAVVGWWLGFKRPA
ncbi:MAG: hypothetical protein IPN29_13090 [Saprospiraceae bacterium]|nr:hypothetical protein [Saprospiraceae bacterium]